MIIEELHREWHGDRPRVSATVIWEQSSRPSQTIYFETSARFADALSCDPHAFVLAMVVPAFHFGEERLRIDAALCPELRVGVRQALSLLNTWYYQGARTLPRIESDLLSSGGLFSGKDRSALFYSGGVDSFAALAANRHDYPKEHTGRFRDGILVYGLELDDPQAFAHVMNILEPLAPRLDLTFIPVYTNIYLIFRREDAKRKFHFWRDEYQGAAFAAIAHALSNRVGRVGAASSDDYAHLIPAGTHPLLEPIYSTRRMQLRYENPEMSRLDKLRLIASWSDARDNLRVCNHFAHYEAGRLNCGKCEKCVRTMLGLLALGELENCRAFPYCDLQPAQIRRTWALADAMVVYSYEELIPLLKERGREDLVGAVQRLLRTNKRRYELRLRRAGKSLRRRLARFVPAAAH